MLRKLYVLGSFLLVLTLGTVIAQETGVRNSEVSRGAAADGVVRDSDDGFDTGLIGLAGLLGLAGLIPRDRHDRSTGTTPTTSR